ncbi:hypothetical protein GGQ85_002907 [Nitrobacter vulgaris]|nr:hypothetical protein [Nitrobacter vulgaris]MDR6305188.1 hypothetical protein [Nitrobacter vulgaris]
MKNYRVSFYKDLLNSNGHNFRCLQRQIDVVSDDPSQALILAKQEIGSERLNIDSVKVVHLANGYSPRTSRQMFVASRTCDDAA